jgi:HK97 gp10 family phage protein
VSSIDGFDDLKRALTALAGAADAGTLVAAGQAGADVLLAGMQRRVPVDTGELRDSLEIELASKADDTVTFAIQSDSDHAEAVERGTRFQHAQPYMRPTVDEDEEAVFAAVETAIRAAILQVAK